MKPTRICDWPPRLDATLRPSLQRWRHRRVRAQRTGRMHPVLYGVARRRWEGRTARQRRFEQPPRLHAG